MRRINDLLLVLLIVLLAVTPTTASEAEWLWFFKASDTGGNNGAPGGYIGTTNSDIDGYQSTRDKYLDFSLIGGMAAYGVRHTNGEESWTGPTGYYRQDMRAPMSGGSKVWGLFYVWAMPGYSGNDIKLAWTPGMSGNYLPVSTISYKLKLISTVGVVYPPAPGTTWTLDPSSAGYILLPTPIAAEGTGHYLLEFSASVPEPGSLATLALGLLGASVYRLRRRK